jgi:hypothetical protein
MRKKVKMLLQDAWACTEPYLGWACVDCPFRDNHEACLEGNRKTLAAAWLNAHPKKPKACRCEQAKEPVDLRDWIGEMVAVWDSGRLIVGIVEAKSITIRTPMVLVNGVYWAHVARVKGHTDRLALPPDQWTDKDEMV